MKIHEMSRRRIRNGKNQIEIFAREEKNLRIITNIDSHIVE